MSVEKPSGSQDSSAPSQSSQGGNSGVESPVRTSAAPGGSVGVEGQTPVAAKTTSGEQQTSGDRRRASSTSANERYTSVLDNDKETKAGATDSASPDGKSDSSFKDSADPLKDVEAWKKGFTSYVDAEKAKLSKETSNGQPYIEKTYADGSTSRMTKDKDGNSVSLVDMPQGRFIVRGTEGGGVKVELPGGVSVAVDRPAKETTKEVNLGNGVTAMIEFTKDGFVGHTKYVTRGPGGTRTDNGSTSEPQQRTKDADPFADSDGWLNTPSSKTKPGVGSSDASERSKPITFETFSRTDFSPSRGEAPDRSNGAAKGADTIKKGEKDKDGKEKGEKKPEKTGKHFFDADSFLKGKLRKQTLLRAAKKALENGEIVCLRSDKPTAWLEAEVVAQLRNEVSGAMMGNLIVLGEKGAATNTYDKSGKPKHEVDKALEIPKEVKEDIKQATNEVKGKLTVDTSCETSVTIKKEKDSPEKVPLGARRALRTEINKILEKAGLNGSHKAILAAGGVQVRVQHPSSGKEHSKFESFINEKENEAHPKVY